jgi:hypothetical protein
VPLLVPSSAPLLVPSSACDVCLLNSFWHCESGSALVQSSYQPRSSVCSGFGCLPSFPEITCRFLWHSTGLVPVLISGFTQGFFGGVGFSLTVLDRTRKRNLVLRSCSLLMSCEQLCIDCFSCRSARLCFACCAQHRTALIISWLCSIL